MVWLSAAPRLRDKHGRAITDLRLSVTDRCNYKCVYCRTGNEGAQYSELPIEEYARMVRLFVSLGVEKVRLTGGEPLLRRGLLELIREIAQMRPAFSPEPLDIALTTNGHLLAGMAKDLKRAGLNRVTVSMDAVDAETFARITRVPGSFERVRDGIRAAQDAGLGPVKVNAVLLRGFNDGEIEAFAEFSRHEGVIVRFIEWMPLEEDRTWTPEAVVRMEEIVTRLNAVRPLVALPANACLGDGAAIHLRRRRGRDRDHRAGVASILRTLQPRARDLRRQGEDLSVLTERPRSCRADAARGKR